MEVKQQLNSHSKQAGFETFNTKDYNSQTKLQSSAAGN